MVGASFTVAAVAQVLRSKKGITAVGNAQIDTAQSKFGGASALFDGTGDYLQLNDASLTLGSDNWTIEFWVRLNNTSGFKNLIDYRPGSAGLYPTIYMENTTIRYFTNGADRITGGTLAANTWYHIAVSKSGSDHKMFIDGTQGGSTYTAANTYIGTSLLIGAYTGGVNSHNGHIDEVRISNSARYTTTFTPSTTPFVNDANTLLLIHANGTDASTFFEDDNGVRAQRAIQSVGNAQISTAQSKFGGSSMLFDGSGDSFVVDHSGQMRFGTGDFTMEFWYRPISKAQQYPVILNNKNGFSSGSIVFSDRHDANNTKLSVYIYNLSSSVPQFISTTTTANNTWYHVALSRSGTSLKLFINGTQEGSTVTTSADIDTGAGTDSYYIGRDGSSSDYNGYIDEVRVSNTARYTANFTAPTQPFVNDANTVLLVHADGTNASTVVRDDNGTTSRYKLQTLPVNNVVISTAQSKFGGSSALFDGDGDHLITYNFPNDDIVGDFTLELWARFDILPATQTIGGGAYMMIYNCTTAPYIFVANNGSNNPQVSLGFDPDYPNYIHTGKTISTNTWYHIAVVRSNGIIRCYWDGSDMGSPSTGDTANLAKHNPFESQIMWGKWHNTRGVWDGYMDEIRISKVARYTSNFTPSASAFTLDDNTLLLLHLDGENNSTVFTDDATVGKRYKKGVTAIGNAQVDTAQSKFGGASALFDGTGDALSTPNHPDFNLNNTANFTVEFWYRPVVISNYPGFIGSQQAGTQNGWMVNLDPSANINWIHGVSVLTATSTGITTNNWYHIAVVRSNTTNLTIYVNGVSKYNTTSYSGSTTVSTDVLRVGAGQGISTNWDGGTYSINGYLDDVRISNTARYTAAFTPPTAPFQNDANTLLLIHADGTDASTVFFDDNGIAPYTP
jgi:hypothetical protein